MHSATTSSRAGKGERIPSHAIVERIVRPAGKLELLGSVSVKTIGLPFTLFEARSINFAIVVYFECMLDDLH